MMSSSNVPRTAFLATVSNSPSRRHDGAARFAAVVVTTLTWFHPTIVHAQASVEVEAAPTPNEPEESSSQEQSQYSAKSPSVPEAVDVTANVDGAPIEPEEAALAGQDASGEAGPVEVTVVGTSLARTAGSARIVGNRELERNEYDDPHAVLASVPGAYSRGEDGLGLRPNISLRGVNPDRSKKIALMEDGIPFGPAPYSAPAAYYFPLMTRMTQVRVIKGPAAISYGPQTITGAIDLMTRPIPYETAGRLDIAGGQFGYKKAHGYFGSSNESAGFLIEGVHLDSDGFKELPNGADTGFSRNEWMFKGNYFPDPMAEVPEEIRLKLTYSDELSNETYLGLTDADFRDDPLQRYGVSQLDQMRNHRTSIVASHIIDPTPELKVTTTAYRHDFFRIWRKVNGFRGADLFSVLADPDSPRNESFYSVLSGEADASIPAEGIRIGPNQREYYSQGLLTLLNWRGNTGELAHRVEYGFRVHNDGVDRRHSEDTFFSVDGELLPEGSPTVVTAFNSASTVALSLHVVDAIEWKNLTVTPGVRFEAMRSSFEDHATSQVTKRLDHAILPGVGAFYSLTPHFGLLAGAYRGFSPPAPGSDPFIGPELSVNYEAGARYSEDRARAEVIGFYNDYQNLTDICTQSSGCVTTNLDRQFDAGEATISGVEAYASHEVPVGSWTLPVSVAYTYTQAVFDNTFQSADPIYGDVESGDEVPYVPRHQANVAIGAENAAVGGYATARYVSAVREQAGSEPFEEALTTDELFLLDVSAKYRVAEPLELYLNVRNLLDSSFIVARRPFGARPNAPRWVQLGAKYSF